MDFTNPGPNGLPTVNRMTDFDWEYVWHCHLLGHEENDMMRPIIMRVGTTAPLQPTGLAAVAAGGVVNLSWIDPTPANDPATLGNPANEMEFRILRSTTSNFSTGVTVLKAPANATSYTDNTVVPGTTYWYRVRTFNPSGGSTVSNKVSATP
jgi:FtsP/CotA-like multicopper oxidase with cupredoxin domain